MEESQDYILRSIYVSLKDSERIHEMCMGTGESPTELMGRVIAEAIEADRQLYPDEHCQPSVLQRR